MLISFHQNQEMILLLKLFIAHVIVDFVIQTKGMVASKKWVSKSMLLHIGLVYIVSAIFTFWWWQSIILALIHYVVDGLKIEAKKSKRFQENHLFLIDQLLHFLTIFIFWVIYFGKFDQLASMSQIFIFSEKNLAIFLGYLIITSPLGFLIGTATQKMIQPIVEEESQEISNGKTDNNGFWIGIFERVIIFTFVLLGKYEAIGFLITGKSLLRFSARNEAKKSEYVLLGTMMSYSVTICIGLYFKLFLS